MAQESRLAIVIDSKTSEEQVKALAEALRSLEGAGIRVTGVSEETSRRLQSLSQEAGKGARGVADLGKSADTTATSLSGVATALASVVSTAKMFGQIQSSMQAAARYEQLGLIMEVVGRNAGIAADELAELEKELQSGGISMTQSRQVITRLVQANIDLSQATRLARLAQDAATIANITSSEALDRLVVGIQTSQVEILRNMGVVVSFEGSYKSLADQLGRTTASLSESEKMTARVNAVLGQGDAIAGAYEISMTNALKQAGSMVRLQEDLNVLMGQMYQPAYSKAIESMSAVIKESQDHAKVLSVALAGVTAAAATATVGILAFSKSFGILRIAMNAIATHPAMMVLSVAAGAATALGVALSHTGKDARIAAIDLDDLTRSLKGLNAEQLAFRQQQAEEKLTALQDEAALAGRELQALEKDYAELVKMFEAGRGVDAEGLENVNRTLVEQRARVADANQAVEKAHGVLARLDDQARAAAGGVQTLNDALAQTVIPPQKRCVQK